MDTDAEFKAWAESVRDQLQRTAYLLCTDWSLADDLVQDALLKVYLRWRKIRTNPTAYAKKAISTGFIDYTRKPWRREYATETLPESAGYGPDPTQGAPIIQALRKVPEGQRTVLILRYWEDMTMEQVAATLGCSVGNAKSQASRGLERLKAELLAIDGIDDTIDWRWQSA